MLECGWYRGSLSFVPKVFWHFQGRYFFASKRQASSFEESARFFAGILIRHGGAVTPSPTWGRQGLCEHSAHIGRGALKKPSPAGEGGPRSGG